MTTTTTQEAVTRVTAFLDAVHLLGLTGDTLFSAPNAVPGVELRVSDLRTLTASLLITGEPGDDGGPRTCSTCGRTGGHLATCSAGWKELARLVDVDRMFDTDRALQRAHRLLDHVETAFARHGEQHATRVTGCEMCDLRGAVSGTALLEGILGCKVCGAPGAARRDGDGAHCLPNVEGGYDQRTSAPAEGDEGHAV